MQKEIIVLFSLFFLSGCSGFRYQKQNEGFKKDGIANEIKLTDIERQNLTNKSFYIQKARVEIISAGEKQNILASVKYINPDSFLISIRSGAGIEAARIFFNSDTILINDRINKIMYYGSPRVAIKKYGLSTMLFPLILGDIVLNESTKSETLSCVNEYSLIDSYLEKCKIVYSIDCNNKKVISLSLINEMEAKSVNIEYKDFKKLENRDIARKVIIHDFKKLDLINIEINKIESPWQGRVDFIPGRNYELVEIK